MSRLAVFAYASLVSPASAAETLGRPVEPVGPARLRGYSRRWTLARDNNRSEKTFAVPDGSRPRFCLGLNLEPDPAGVAANGALIEVDQAELERLDLREVRYDRLEITGALLTDALFDAVYAYRAKPEHRRPTPPPGSVIVSNYTLTIEAAFAALGPDELELYRATTAPPPVDVVEATLVADAIPEGNPRAW